MNAPISLKGLKAQQEWKFSSRSPEKMWITLISFPISLFVVLVIIFLLLPRSSLYSGKGLFFGFLYFYLTELLVIPFITFLTTLFLILIKNKVKLVIKVGSVPLLIATILSICLLYFIYELIFSYSVMEFIFSESSMLVSLKDYQVVTMKSFITTRNVFQIFMVALFLVFLFSISFYYLAFRIAKKLSIEDEISVGRPFIAQFIASPFISFVGFLFYDTEFTIYKVVAIFTIFLIVYLISCRAFVFQKWKSSLACALFFSTASIILSALIIWV